MLLKKIKIKKITIITLIIFSIIDVAASYFYYNYTKKYLEKYRCDKSDVAIVFFAGFDKNKNLDTMQKARLNKAIELFNLTTIDCIICVGGNREKQNLHGSMKSKEYLISKGIPSDKIYYDLFSFDTKSNLNEAHKMASEKGFNKLCYISDAIHLHRISKFSHNANYCLQDIDYNFTMFQIIRMSNQSFFSFILEKILNEETYIKFIHSLRD